MQHLSFFDSIHFFMVTRSGGEIFLIFLLLSLPLLFFIIREFNRFRVARELKKRRQAIYETLQTAQLQNESFEIQLGDQDSRTAYSALLNRLNDDEMELLAFNHIPKVWEGEYSSIFFCVREKKQRIFYKFQATIRSIDPHEQSSIVRVRIPGNLEIGQKRAFFRIAPLPNSVRVLALWALSPTDPLPRATHEIGTPLISCTMHKANAPSSFLLNVEDISGSGIGLRLQTNSNDDRLVKDGQILCLVVYNEAMHGAERLVNFMCTGRITNIRQDPEKENSRILGIEFTNWAFIEKGVPTINWFHQTKATGIGPILQWVTKMDMENRKNSSLDLN
ncbi:MAG: hypothetical protein J5803_03955 [Desulfovibrio sp.]|nr:hypothetical protein [Desulfovibrio sp.]